MDSSNPHLSDVPTVTSRPLLSAADDPDAEPKEFTTLRRLYREVLTTEQDCLIYRGIPTDLFPQIERWRDRSGRIRRLFYLAETGDLVVTIPTVIYEQLHLCLYDEIRHKITRMGVDERWTTKGAATWKFGSGSGEPDRSGGPYKKRGKGSAWPTLIVQAGKSQGRPSLRGKMRWWFAASSAQVKIVLLAKFESQNRNVVVEKWIVKPQRARSGAATTRAHAARQIEPYLDHTVTITRPTNSPNDVSVFAVEGAPLVLEFELLFLRPPGMNGRDIQVQEPDLRDWAMTVWNQMS